MIKISEWPEFYEEFEYIFTFESKWLQTNLTF